MNQRRWTALLTVLLIAGLTTLAWLSRRPLCIKSQLVQKIDRVHDQGVARVYSCSQNIHVEYDDELRQLVEALEPELERLEEFFSTVPSAAPVQLDFTLVNDQSAKDTEHSLEQYRVQVRSGVQQILWSRPQASIISTAEAILTSVTEAQLGIPGTHLQENRMHFAIASTVSESLLMALGLKNYERAAVDRWSFLLTSRSAYCNSDERSLLDTGLCQKAASFDVIEPMALKPFFRESFWQALLEQSLSERPEFLKHIVSRLMSWSQATSLATMTVDSAAVSEFIAQLEMKSDVKSKIETEKFTNALKRAYAQKGWSAEPAPMILPQMVYFMESETNKNKSTQDMSAFLFENPNLRDRLVALRTGSWVWMPHQNAPVEIAALGPMKVFDLVVVLCEPPNDQFLKSISDNTDRVLVIQQCDSKKVVKLESYFSGDAGPGVEAFARDNPGVPFMRLHMPSLKLAWQKDHSNPFLLLSQKKWDHHFFTQLGWQTPEWNEQLQMFKSRSVIEAIEAYRF